MTKQNILDAMTNGEIKVGESVKNAVIEKLATMPDGEWSQEQEVAFDDFLSELSEDYFAASDDLAGMANDLELAVDDIDANMKKTSNQVLDELYTTAQSMQDVSA